MTEEEYLKKLSYDAKIGRIDYWNPEKGFGKIISNDIEKIHFRENNIINNHKNIETGVEVEFILDDSNPKNLKAEKIVLKNKRTENVFFARLVDTRNENNFIVKDENGKSFVVDKGVIINYDNDYVNAYVKVKQIDSNIDSVIIVNKGYVNWLYSDKNGGSIFSLTDNQEYKFKIFNLENTNDIIEQQIVYFKISDDQKFANDIFVTKERYKF